MKREGQRWDGALRAVDATGCAAEASEPGTNCCSAGTGGNFPTKRCIGPGLRGPYGYADLKLGFSNICT